MVGYAGGGRRPDTWRAMEVVNRKCISRARQMDSLQGYSVFITKIISGTISEGHPNNKS